MDEEFNDEGNALALFIELDAYLDPELTEHDKSIVLRKIKSRMAQLPRPTPEHKEE